MGKIQTEKFIMTSKLDKSLTREVLSYHERNWDFFKPWVPTYPTNFLTIEYQIERLRLDQQMLNQGSLLKFWVIDIEETLIIGDITFSNIIRGPFQSCAIGLKIDQDHNNQGYGTDAVKTGLDVIFNRLMLHRVEANIMPGNIASRKVFEKAGFLEEGYVRKLLKINGQWEDHLRYAAINPLDY